MNTRGGSLALPSRHQASAEGVLEFENALYLAGWCKPTSALLPAEPILLKNPIGKPIMSTVQEPDITHASRKKVHC